MKRIQALLLVAAVLAFFAACGGKETKSQQAEEKELVSSFNIVHGLRVYSKKETENTDGTKTVTLERDRSVNLSIGEPLKSTGETLKFEDKNYVAVRTESGKDIYIRDIWFNPNGKLGVVTSNDAVIYSKPDNLSPTANKIPRRTIVVFSNDEDANFCRIVAYMEETKKYILGDYLKKEDISGKEADVQSSILYFVSSIKKSDVEKKELLKTAISEYSSSVFFDEIKTEYEMLANPDGSAGSSDAVDIATAPINYKAVANDFVKVYSYPDQDNAGIVARLDEGSEVEVIEKTVDTFSISGLPTDVWYKIAEPEGWIFGVYLDPK